MTPATNRATDASGSSVAQLLAANEELRRSNSNLRRLCQATADGLELLDQQTNGQLRLLVDQASDELAALVDRVLERPEQSA
jgi:hypothetical protein